MSELDNKISLRHTIFENVMLYSENADQLGHQVRQQVFGFGLRSTVPSDRWSLPVKLVNDHRLLQRQRIFQQTGGSYSSIALYALKKARQKEQ